DTRFYAAVLSLFAAVALLLATVGVYGVVSQGVSERTREFGLRIAIGATPEQVLRMVLGQTAVPLGVGVAIGIVAATPAVRVLAALLFGVEPSDVWTFAMVAV